MSRALPSNEDSISFDTCESHYNNLFEKKWTIKCVYILPKYLYAYICLMILPSIDIISDKSMTKLYT